MYVSATHTPEGSKLVRAYLAAWGHRVKVHYLPKYSPDTNPIERVWWRLHEAVSHLGLFDDDGEVNRTLTGTTAPGAFPYKKSGHSPTGGAPAGSVG